jgi:NADH-quinone oxidoreductase subunit L
MLISSLVALAGIALAAVIYMRGPNLAEGLARAARPLYTLSYRKFYFDEVYSALVVWPLRALAYICYIFDRFIIDGLVNLFGWIPALFGYLLRSLQNGMVQFYALAMVLGLLVLMAALVMRP